MTTRINEPPLAIIVDDDQALLRALKFSLELEGLRVETHRSGATVDVGALPATGACLVVDYVLPGATGLDLLLRLRAAKVALPAILITTHASESLRNAADSLGASVVLKPLIGPELTAEIRARLSQSPLITEAAR